MCCDLVDLPRHWAIIPLQSHRHPSTSLHGAIFSVGTPAIGGSEMPKKTKKRSELTSAQKKVLKSASNSLNRAFVAARKKIRAAGSGRMYEARSVRPRRAVTAGVCSAKGWRSHLRATYLQTLLLPAQRVLTSSVPVAFRGAHPSAGSATTPLEARASGRLIGNSNPFLSSLKAAEWRCDRFGSSAPCLPR